MVTGHRAQQEGANLAGAAELQKLARVRESDDGILHLPEPSVKPFLELRQGDMRDKFIVKNGERQAKLRAEPFQRHRRAIG